ncbi:hypothetical protein CEXT_198091 [Caerostris extrusa]|uniref:Uncharacterized protein n=1 Tax=Caerostris extrusa TaxID=172846 RepID=A0AAV4W5S0_CAEEX|nr:hypothetical protein CEXT_198091 [Caerostris extrusa]
MIQKWKVNGDCHNVPRVGRHTRLGDRDLSVLSREIRKNLTHSMAFILHEIRDLSMAHILHEFQQASESISINTIRKKHNCLNFMVVLPPISLNLTALFC